MKEYIEREALIKRLRVTPILMYGIPVYARDGVIDLVEKLPAADVVERKRGEWVDVVYDPVWKKMKATCNSCQCRGEVRVKSNCCGFAVPDSDFCPNCGADMRGVDHDQS